MNMNRQIQQVRELGRWLRPALFALAIVAGTARTASSSDDDVSWATGTPDFKWSGALKPGQTVEIKGINGRVSAEPASGKEVEIVAWKHGGRSDPAKVRIEMVPSAAGITVCAVYPTPSGDTTNDCEAGDGGNMNTRDNDVQVRFKVKIPDGVGFTARTVNGRVVASGLTGPISARTVNGSVDVTTTSTADAETVNGSIHARLGATTWSDELEFRTVNGHVEIEVPPTVNADLEVNTVNGSIDSELPWVVQGKIGRTHMRGTINKGGSRLKVETVNGSVKIGTGT
jgi:Putative adhesin